MQAQIRVNQKPGWKQLSIGVICYAFILLFIYAGFYKLLDMPLFGRELAQSPVIGKYKDVLKWLIPLAELAMAIMLFFPTYRLRGMVMATLLMAGFTIYIAYLLVFAPWVPCSCGGILATMDWGDHLVFNSLFVVLGCINIVLLRKEAQK